MAEIPTYYSPSIDTHMCNCIGPQKGEPVCPCQMRNVFIRDGRYIKREVDLGPVKSEAYGDIEDSKK